MKSKNIVYLYSEIMPYNMIVFEALLQGGYSIHAFEYLNSKKTPYRPKMMDGLCLYNSDDFCAKSLLNKVIGLKPCIIVICGWSFKDYLFVARYFKKNSNIPTISPIDSQYLGTLKQKIGFLTSPFYIKRFFTHIWVPGVRQYYFAKRLGYSDENIIMNSLSGDVNLFNKVSIERKIQNYPKCFLFVGRYHKVKGLDVLLNAWSTIKDKNGWRLRLVGNGPMRQQLIGYEDVEVCDFMDQNDLIQTAQNAGCFVLPSVYEPWALVLHEFAAAGLPIICTSTCGASPHYVVDGYNGYKVRKGDIENLKYRMEQLIFMSKDELMKMSYNSRELSKFVSPELSAQSLLSVIK